MCACACACVLAVIYSRLSCVVVYLCFRALRAAYVVCPSLYGEKTNFRVLLHIHIVRLQVYGNIVYEGPARRGGMYVAGLSGEYSKQYSHMHGYDEFTRLHSESLPFKRIYAYTPVDPIAKLLFATVYKDISGRRGIIQVQCSWRYVRIESRMNYSFASCAI